MLRCDIAIVGAGPAGTSAAIAALTANPGAHVLLFERRPDREKPCGGGVSHAASRLLNGLGVDLPLEATHGAAIRLLSPNGRALEIADSGFSAFRRQDFDSLLRAHAVANGALLLHESVRSVRIVDRGVVVNGSILANRLIAADGAESRIRRLVAPRWRPAATALAMRAYVSRAEPTRTEHLVAMAPGVAPSYAWSFELGNGVANIGFGRRCESYPLLRDEFVEVARTLLALDGAMDRIEFRRVPFGSPILGLPDSEIVFVGDAAALANPLTAAGIYRAVLSGMLAGYAAGSSGMMLRSYRSALHGYRTTVLRRWQLLASRSIARPYAADLFVRGLVLMPRLKRSLVQSGLS